jgi:hypothetical protein
MQSHILLKRKVQNMRAASLKSNPNIATTVTKNSCLKDRLQFAIDMTILFNNKLVNETEFQKRCKQICECVCNKGETPCEIGYHYRHDKNRNQKNPAFLRCPNWHYMHLACSDKSTDKTCPVEGCGEIERFYTIAESEQERAMQLREYYIRYML